MSNFRQTFIMGKKAKRNVSLREQLFRSMINRPTNVAIKHLATLLDVDPKSCINYLKCYVDELDKNSVKGRFSFDEDGWMPGSEIIFHDDSTGYCNGFYLTNPSFVDLSLSNLQEMVNNLIYLPESIQRIHKSRLIKLFSYYIYKPAGQLGEKSCIDTLKIIAACLKEKKMMRFSSLVYEINEGDQLARRQQIIVNKASEKGNVKNEVFLSPIYFDEQNLMLHAYLVQPESRYRDDSEIEIIHFPVIGIKGANISNLDLIEPEMIYDVKRITPTGIKHEKIDEENKEISRIFVDVLGNVTRNPDRRYSITLHLNDYGKAKLLMLSPSFTGYIKQNKTSYNALYPYILKVTLVEISIVASFIIQNVAHVRVCGDKEFKRALNLFMKSRQKALDEMLA